MYSLVISRLLLYYRSIRYQSNIVKYRKFLAESQWWSRDRLVNHQNNRLKIIIKHAAVNVPYYRQLFKELGISVDEFSIDQLDLIPPVSKAIIKDNYKDFIAINANNYRHRKVNTSGSTGSPFEYLQDYIADEMQVASSYRGLGFAGYLLGDKLIQIAGSALIPGSHYTNKQKFSHHVQRIKNIPAIKLDTDILNNIVKEINDFSPLFIRGYPSSIYILANHIANENNLRHRPNAIITTAEVLLPKYRGKIEEVFGCPVFDEYGCNDGGLISYECKEHNGFHYAAEKTILEITQRGKSVATGEFGDVTLTDLYNLSQPFIRYKNGDIAKLSKHSCSCLRSLPLIEAVQGRSGDIMKFHDRYISTPALTLIFKDFSFDLYQLIKKADNLLIINVIKGKSYESFEEEKLLNILRHHLGDQVNIQLNFVSTIETTSAGKWKYFVDMSASNEI